MDSFPLGLSVFQLPTASASTPADLRVETVLLDGRLLVLLHGEVDMASSGVLASLAQQVAALGLPVAVDASQVSFMDCAGLASALSLTSDGRLSSITAASRPVQVLLDAVARAELLLGLLPLPASRAATAGPACARPSGPQEEQDGREDHGYRERR